VIKSQSTSCASGRGGSPKLRRNWTRRAFLKLITTSAGVLAPVVRLHSRAKSLWPGARYSSADRDHAIERGLEFIERIASKPEHFSRFGHDLIFCFYTISNTAKNAKLRALAHDLVMRYARQWRHDNPDPPGADPDALFLFAEGAAVADRTLGLDAALKQRVRLAAEPFSVVDFLRFDPGHEPPPKDIPEACSKCNFQNPRGADICQKCQTPLTFHSPYDIWLDSLIMTHESDSYGIKLGASYPEALQWISRMRPYPPPGNDEQAFDDVAYTVTHIVYTLNDYHTYRLSPAWLPQEFRYLKRNIRVAERYQDWELVGEFMDALRAFGVDESAPEIRDGMSYLLSHQNSDGSWGNMDDDDIYTRYHSTWTAIDGLREYSFHGEGLHSPDLLAIITGRRAIAATSNR